MMLTDWHKEEAPQTHAHYQACAARSALQPCYRHPEVKGSPLKCWAGLSTPPSSRLPRTRYLILSSSLENALLSVWSLPGIK